MALLDDFSRKFPGEFVVAHFDHGTRPSSKTDAEFVRKKATEYGADFYLGEGQLGPEVSEADARAARYEFLYKVAKKVNAEKIVTAHHLHDLAETVAINILRGTGWRGLAPFYSNEIYRPFTQSQKPFSKIDIYKFADAHELAFRQDPTNTEDKYLRNRLREKIFERVNNSSLKELAKLYQKQTRLRKEIENIAESLVPENGIYRRSWFYNLDDEAAMEILRAGLARKKISLTRPQMVGFLKAIREYKPGKKFNLPSDKLVTIRKDIFVL